MNIGFVGLGKLGLPVALSVAKHGHTVYGYEINDTVIENIKNRYIPYKEIRAQEYMDSETINLSSLNELVKQSEIIFMPIQTPHEPQFEGTTIIPPERADFNYEFLKKGVESVVHEATILRKHVTLVIISTVLPGTIEREILPRLTEFVNLVYNPFFIAMGTTIPDFEKPEFVLIGVDKGMNPTKLKMFYESIHNRPLFFTDIKTAELTKVAYNTFLGMKITFINAMMEICEKTGANVDDLSDALSLATDRLISPKYLRGGMGDGGGCHPRDNIAMSWLAQELPLSHDIFLDEMKAREDQTEWLADLIENTSFENPELPIVILGKSYKAATNLTVGSPATLLANILKEKDIEFEHLDPEIDEGMLQVEQPGIYFIATNHEQFKEYYFAEGSIVLDPWGYIPDQDGVEVHRIGRQT